MELEGEKQRRGPQERTAGRGHTIYYTCRISFRIDVTGEGKGEEKEMIFVSKRSPCQALRARRSEVTSLKL